MLAQVFAAVGLDHLAGRVQVSGEGALPSAYRVTDLAVATIAAAAAAAQAVAGARAGGETTGAQVGGEITVDRRLASLWFGSTIRPLGWELPSLWDAIAGDYPAADGWIRLHTNAPHHRAAALSVLGTGADRAAVGAAVTRWPAGELEAAVVGAGGCAAAMRDEAAWAVHPQGGAVAAEPLLARHDGEPAGATPPPGPPSRPLQGVRVLDLTRVLAGPVATRFLAGLGADVLRIDPPIWDEPGVLPEVTLGKRCARIDLRQAGGRALVLGLLERADIVVHGYRPGALDSVGLGERVRQEVAPHVVDVSLNAYGWTGPWSSRRGFDSLVQMSAGIANAGMRRTGAAAPKPLPVQALDHATGYLLAAAALAGWHQRLTTGAGSTWRASLARTAALLVGAGAGNVEARIAPASEADEAAAVEVSSWGPMRRLRPPVRTATAELRWDLPAGALGREATPGWLCR
jgi:hypothetical protein